MSDPLGFQDAFATLHGAFSDSMYAQYEARLRAGKRLPGSDNPRTFEGKIEAYYNQHKSLTRAEFDRLKEQHYGPDKNRKPGPPPAPPAPKPSSGPAPLVSPLSPGLLASMAAAAAVAPGYPAPTPPGPTWVPLSPAPPIPPSPPAPAPPPPPPRSPWPANMQFGGGGQGQPPPPPPAFPYSFWSPASNQFPQNMQPRVPKPPRPKPTRFQTFKSTFGQAYARQARYGVASVGRAGQAAFAGVFPKVQIGLAIANEAKRAIIDTVKGLHDFAERINEANKGLAPFSAKLQMAYAQLALNDLYRAQHLSRKLEDPAAALTRFVDEMRQFLMPFMIATAQARMEGASFGAGAIGGLGRELKPIADLFNGVKSFFDPEGGAAHSLGDSIVAGMVGAFNPMIGPMIAGIQTLNDLLGFESKAEIVGPGGPWEGMILQQAGPNRADPIIPNRQVNLGARR